MTAPVKQLSDANPGGTGLGQSATDTISFFGVTPVAQRSGSAQAALTLTTATASGVGFTTTTAFSAFVAQVNEIAATLSALGLWKGAA
jgi:hypothetical protein